MDSTRFVDYSTSTPNKLNPRDITASMDMSFELFPGQNRGRQGLTCSLMALAIAHTFEITCFVKGVVDSILVYGDKLYTFIKKSMKKQLLSDPTVTLQEDEVRFQLFRKKCIQNLSQLEHYLS